MQRVEDAAHRNDYLIEEIKNTYDTFKKVAYDPHMQNQTRLFVIEAQLKELEKQRTAEFYYLKDLVKKSANET